MSGVYRDERRCASGETSERRGSPAGRGGRYRRWVQALVLHYPLPDGRVDPQGRMLCSLATGSAPRAAAAAPEQSWLDALGQ